MILSYYESNFLFILAYISLNQYYTKNFNFISSIILPIYINYIGNFLASLFYKLNERIFALITKTSSINLLKKLKISSYIYIYI